MMKRLWLVSLCILLASCKTSPRKPSPPVPPGAERSSILSFLRPKAKPEPAITPLPGFRITNLEVVEDEVVLSWKEAPSGAVMVQGRPTLTSPWTNIGNATVRDFAVFPKSKTGFIRLQGSYPLVSIWNTNQPRVTWSAPDPMPTDKIARWTCYRKTLATTAPAPVPADFGPGDVFGPPLTNNLTTDGVKVIPSPGGQQTFKVLEDIGWVTVQDLAASPKERGDYFNLEGYGQFRVIGKNIATKELVMEYSSLANAPNNQHAGETAGSGLRFSQASLRDSTTVPASSAFYYYELGITDQGQEIQQNPVGMAGVAIGAGSAKWAMRIGGTQYYDTAQLSRLALDASGSFLAVGTFVNTVDVGGQQINSSSKQGMFVAKYGSVNQLIWPSQPVITSTGVNNITGVAADASGNIYGCGYWNGTIDFGGSTTVASLGNSDCFVVKYSGTDGSRLWYRTMRGTGFDQANGITVDSAGNVVAIGSFSGTVNFGESGTDWELSSNNGSTDIFLVKLNPSTGNTIWAKKFGGTSTDRGIGIVATSTGAEIITIGTFTSSSVDFGGITKDRVGSQDLFVVRYNSAGVAQWANTYGGFFSLPSIGVSASDQFAITGFFGGTVNLGGDDLIASSGSKIFTAKYSGAGSHVWSREDGNDGDQGTGVAVDSLGAVYLVGVMRAGWDFGNGLLTYSPLSRDPFAVKFDATDGHSIWSKRYTYGVPGSGSDQDAATCVVVNSTTGEVVVGGGFTQRIDFGGAAGYLVAAPSAFEGFLLKIAR